MRVLQRYLPVLTAWRKCRLESRKVRTKTFLVRSQLNTLHAFLLFEDERERIAKKVKGSEMNSSWR